MSVKHWLTVYGGGKWSVGQYSFEGGPHEVTEELADVARGENYAWLKVTSADDAPAKLVPIALSGPLTMADIQEGTEDVKANAELMAPPAIVEIVEVAVVEPANDPKAIRNEAGRIPCPFTHDGCDKDYVSSEALERHLDVKHGDVIAGLIADATATISEVPA